LYVLLENNHNILPGSQFLAYGETPYTNDTSNGNQSSVDEFTLLLYIIASNLGEEAEKDISEILNANLTNSNVNVIIQVGGGDQPKFSTVQRYQISNHQKISLDVNESQHMVDDNTLFEFINRSIAEFPAKKYGLILWDHGEGVKGFGSDANLNNANLNKQTVYFLKAFQDQDTLHLSELGSIKENVDSSLDSENLEFIGFDSCLMGTAEVASVLSSGRPLSRFLVASEEIVPNWGWNYTTIINSISANSSISGEALGNKIIQSYVNDSKRESREREFHADRDITLSVIDLERFQKIDLKGKMEGLINDYTVNVNSSSSFLRLLRGIDIMEHFGQSASNDYTQSNTGLVDIFEFLTTIGDLFPSLKEKTDSIYKDINSTIIHNYNAESHPNSRGLSIYLPINSQEFIAMKKIENYSSVLLGGGWLDFLDKIEAYTNEKNNFSPGIKSLRDNGYVRVHVSGSDIQSIYALFILNSSKGKPIAYIQKIDPRNITEDGYFSYNTNKMLGLCNEDEDTCIPASMSSDITENLTKFFIRAQKIGKDKTPTDLTLVYDLRDGEFLFLGGIPKVKEDDRVAKEKARIEKGDLLYTQGLEGRQVSESILKLEPRTISTSIKNLLENFAQDRHLQVIKPTHIKPKMIDVDKASLQFIFCDYSDNCEKTRVYNLDNRSKAAEKSPLGGVIISQINQSTYSYVNNDYNFQLEFPTNWISISQDIYANTLYLHDPIVAVFYPKEEILYSNGTIPDYIEPHVSIIVHDIIEGNDSNQEPLMRYYNAIRFSVNIDEQTPKHTSLGKNPAFEFSFTEKKGPMQGYYFSTIMGGKEYHILLDVHASKYEKYVPIVKKMISTFNSSRVPGQSNADNHHALITEKESLQELRDVVQDQFAKSIKWQNYSDPVQNFFISLPYLNVDNNLTAPVQECDKVSNQCIYVRHAFLPKFDFIGDDINMFDHISVVIVNGSKISNSSDLLREKLRSDELRDTGGFKFSNIFDDLENSFNYSRSDSHKRKFLDNSFGRIDEESYLEPHFNGLLISRHFYTIIDDKFLSIRISSKPSADTDHDTRLEKIIDSFELAGGNHN
jgi:hypothetical protein